MAALLPNAKPMLLLILTWRYRLLMLHKHVQQHYPIVRILQRDKMLTQAAGAARLSAESCVSFKRANSTWAQLVEAVCGLRNCHSLQFLTD